MKESEAICIRMNLLKNKVVAYQREVPKNLRHPNRKLLVAFSDLDHFWELADYVITIEGYRRKDFKEQ
jgi:predicted ABC-class ATPase